MRYQCGSFEKSNLFEYCRIINILFLFDDDWLVLGIYTPSFQWSISNVFVDLMTYALQVLMIIVVAHRSKTSQYWLIIHLGEPLSFMFDHRWERRKKMEVIISNNVRKNFFFLLEKPAVSSINSPVSRLICRVININRKHRLLTISYCS